MKSAVESTWPLTEPEILAGRLPELDGVRGMAMLLVLVWHYFAIQMVTQPGSLAAYGMKFFSLTWAGVDLFFVLSGFLIGGILLDNRTAPNYFKAFYVRRICRIFPLYYFMVGVFVLAVAVGFGMKGGVLTWLFGDPMPLWSYIIYFQNVPMAYHQAFGPSWMGVTWSLAVEEQFYVVLPLLVRFVPKRLLPWLFGFLVASAPVIRILLFFFFTGSRNGLAGYLLLPGRWDALFLGALGAWCVRQSRMREWLYNNIKWIRCLVLISSSMVFALLITSQGVGSLGMTAGGHTVLAILSLGLVLLSLLSNKGVVARVFRQPWLIWLGTVSYGVYIYHQPVSGILHGLFQNTTPQIAGWTDAGVTLLSLACTLGIAVMSWRWFERPIVQLGHRVKYRG